MLNTGKEIEQGVQGQLAPLGLNTFGWFETDGLSGLLIGNIGSGLWEAFRVSPEARDGLADPMNRWTQNNLTPIADALGAEIRFPFGETIWPFQHYAKLATGMEQSPIGLLIHPKYGLWTAFRAALMFEDVLLREGQVQKVSFPCATCIEKPCLNICPVGAFSKDGFDYQACRSYLAELPHALCNHSGCQARNACPVGPGFAYKQEHQIFHMRAFM